MIPRYTREKMGQLWTLKSKFEAWRQVEIAAMRAWTRLGDMPMWAAEEVEERTSINVDRIKEIEAETRHDVVAFVTSLAEQVDEAGRHIHYGLTSSDVIDTALGLQLKKAGDLLLQEMEKLQQALGEQARKYKYTPMVGRTHGVHAEPMTWGLKLALWYEDLSRAKQRMKSAVQEAACGKISGAVGTYAQVPPQLESMVCEELELQSAPVSSQIVGRDRHAAFLVQLAMTGALLEKIATEIRNLQKTEVREVEEPFRSGQKGSSSMPHKRNPIVTERVSGLSRVLRSNASSAMENIALWHERDISHSSVERVIIPDSTILLDYMLDKMTYVISDMHVYPENMMRNLNHTGGLVFSQKVLLSLVSAGLSREQAYEIVQSCAMEAWQGGKTFQERIRADDRVTEHLSSEQLDKCFDVNEQIENVDIVFERLGLV